MIKKFIEEKNSRKKAQENLSEFLDDLDNPSNYEIILKSETSGIIRKKDKISLSVDELLDFIAQCDSDIKYVIETKDRKYLKTIILNYFNR